MPSPIIPHSWSSEKVPEHPVVAGLVKSSALPKLRAPGRGFEMKTSDGRHRIYANHCLLI